MKFALTKLLSFFFVFFISSEIHLLPKGEETLDSTVYYSNSTVDDQIEKKEKEEHIEMKRISECAPFDTNIS